MLSEDELLARMAGVLRRDIGPAVADGFAKTQAFMAGVILEKVAGQLRRAAADDRADRADAAALAADLDARLHPGDPAALRAAVGALAQADVEVGPALHELVTRLYDGRTELGAERFEQLLGRTRTALRARLDRQLAYSA